MTGDVVGAALAVFACGCALMRSRHGDRRLRGLTPTPSRVKAASAARSRRSGIGPAVVIAVAVAWIVGGVVGWLVGAVCGVAFQRVFARLEPAATRGRRLQLVRDLPIALDLLSACLAAGTPVPAAVGAVGKAVGGPVGAEFAAVLAALDLGSTPAEAWQTLPAGPLRPIGRAIARAITSGAPLADVTAALAAEQRAALHAVAGAAARRAGVAAVGPLGVCFLPAFFGTAVVPIVAGLARHLAS